MSRSGKIENAVWVAISIDAAMKNAYVAISVYIGVKSALFIAISIDIAIQKAFFIAMPIDIAIQAASSLIYIGCTAIQKKCS